MLRSRRSTEDAHPDADLAVNDELVDAVLAASDALVALAARTLADVTEEVTLTQYRVLAELAPREGLRLVDLADVLGVGRSTATRMSDRLAGKGLVRRRRRRTDRRSIAVTLTSSGRELVDQVSAHRYGQIAAVVRRLASDDRRALIAALRAFTDAARAASGGGLTAGSDA